MEKIEQYLEKAKNEKEIIPISEIETILSYKKEIIQSPNYFTILFFRRELLYPVAAAFVVLIIATIGLFIIDRTSSNYEVYIPEGQKRVFQLVKNIQTHPENSKITLSQFGDETNQEIKAIPTHLRSKFELTEEQLKLLGITFKEQYITYEGNVVGKGYVSFSVEKSTSISVSVDDKQKKGVSEYSFYPWFLSEENGRQGVRYRFENEDSLKMTDAFFFSTIDQLIPIQVSRPGFKKVIFWYSQTPELMTILESSVLHSDLSAGIENVDDKKKTIDIQLFPTITKGQVNVACKVIKEQDLEISVLNSSGELMMMPVDNQHLMEGEQNFTMDLSNFKKGLYFVRIRSNPGLTTIHRLFKE